MSEAIAESTAYAPLHITPANSELESAYTFQRRILESISYYRNALRRSRRVALQYSKRKNQQIPRVIELLDNPDTERLIELYTQYIEGNRSYIGDFRTYLRTHPSRAASQFQRRYEQYRELKSKYFMETRRLPEAQQILARARTLPAKKHVVYPQQLLDELHKHPHIDAATVRSAYDHVLRIRLRLRKMYMDPSHTHAEAEARRILEKLDCYPDTRIPLDPMEIEFSIYADGNWDVRHVSGTFIPGYDRRFMIHPHWINPAEPCLGDFNQPISDAVNDGDVELAINLFIMYLKQYNPSDSAGAYFFLWRVAIDHDLPRLRDFTHSYDDEQDENIEEFYIYENFLESHCERYTDWEDYRI